MKQQRAIHVHTRFADTTKQHTILFSDNLDDDISSMRAAQADNQIKNAVAVFIMCADESVKLILSQDLALHTQTAVR